MSAHGTVSRYTNESCRCDDCKAAASAYQRTRKQRRRIAGVVDGICGDIIDGYRPGERAAGLVLVASIEVGVDVDRLAQATGLPAGTVAEVARWLYRWRIWEADPAGVILRYDWLQAFEDGRGAEGVVGFISQAMAATGDLIVHIDETDETDERIAYQLASGRAEHIEAMTLAVEMELVRMLAGDLTAA